MSQVYQNFSQLSPLEWEENNNLTASIKSFPSTSVTSSSFLSKATSNSSINSCNYQKNAGNTPKKSFMAKNSLEILRDKFEFPTEIGDNFTNSLSKIDSKNAVSLQNERKTEVEEDTCMSSLTEVVNENIIFLQNEKKTEDEENTSMSSLTQVVNENIISLQNEKKTKDEENTSLSSLTKIVNENIVSLQSEKASSLASTIIIEQKNSNTSNQFLLSSFGLNYERNTSSLLTLDRVYDSDVDMFEDLSFENGNSKMTLESPPGKNLADYSSEYDQDKFNFKPRFASTQTHFLEKELLDVNDEKIEQAVNGIISFLDHSN